MSFTYSKLYSLCTQLARLYVFVIVILHITVVACQNVETRKAYIVYMGEREHTDVKLLTKSHHEMLASVLGMKEAAVNSMLYSYKHGFSGFAAIMTQSQAQYVAELPGVVQVFPNRLYKIQTTRSWDYLGLSQSSTPNLLEDAKQGDGVIIGVMDTGVWPESKSFNDKGLGPIPARWKGYCQSGESFDPAKHCNKKLIGARYFGKGFFAEVGIPYNGTEKPDFTAARGLFDAARQQSEDSEDNDFLSARDGAGHGTHCASTAGGSYVTNVSVNGLAHGTVRGGAPRARIAVYKVGWAGGVVTSADIFKAFDEAIHDGVDILSVSLGLDMPLYEEIDRRDIIYYGSFHAVANGITVVCSAGNEGPKQQTVLDVAPWVITVAASTIDRSFPTPIILGNNKKFAGQSMYHGKGTGFVKLVHNERASDLDDQKFCDSLTGNDTWVAGKVVLCFNRHGLNSPVQATNIVISGGGVGLIAAVNTFDFLSPLSSDFPVVLVSYDVGTQILNYFRYARNPKVQLKPSQTYTGNQVSTYIAAFSSRGPNSISPAILKPDIAAPGVDILAAYIPTASNVKGYRFDSGTSMAAPHVAGVVALIKSLHPNWSPAAIRSALVTTAWTKDPHNGEPIFTKGDMHKPADPFDYGGGLVNPNAARNPGLVFDLGTQDYTKYLCAMGYGETAVSNLAGKAKSCHIPRTSVLDLNLPSITIPNLKDEVTVTRIATNVGDPNSKYSIIINPPEDTVVKVNPMYLLFNPKIKKISFNVTITTYHKATTEYYFGSLVWVSSLSDDALQVRMPISVKTLLPDVYGN